MRLSLVAIALSSCITLPAQNDSSFLAPASQFNKTRFYTVAGGIGLGTGLSLVLLNQYWYSDFPRSSFHFFDDSGEWLQMDKAGHAFNAYYMSDWASDLFRWAGVDKRTSDWVGAATGTGLLLSIEILDGFSEKWGASVSDFGANVFGSAMFLSQQLLWDAQKLKLKVSAFPQDYSTFTQDVQTRAQSLFGQAFLEKVIKDYNGTTLWLSANVQALSGLGWWPKWLSAAFGYGAQNLFGGFANHWCDDQLIAPEHCAAAALTDRTDIPRYRQWYFSPDIDLSSVETQRRGLRVLLDVLNIVKFPAPALEYNRIDGLKFHALFF